MKKIIILASLFGSLSANINVQSLDIFVNKTFVNQKLDISKKSVALLANVNFEELKFKLPSSCFLNNSALEHLSFKNDKLTKQIEEIKDKISTIKNKIKSLKSNIAYLERTSISNLSNVKSLIETSKFLKEEIQNDLNKIYDLQKENKKNNEVLILLNKKRENSRYSRLNYDISCKQNSFAIISYPIYNIRKNSFYDINYDDNKNELNIKNSAFLTQASGVDFKNIDINFYTYNYTSRLSPSIFKPEYLDLHKYKEEQVMYDAPKQMQAVALMAKSKNAPKYTYKEASIRAYYQASNITLLSGIKTDVTFSNDIYKAKSKVEIDGYASSQGFFKVDFKSKKLYAPMYSKLHINGIYVGQNMSKEIKKAKKSFIYFSTNRFINVKKELIKDIKEEPFFSLNKLKTQKIWKYTISNESNKKQKISLVERIPVSKHEDIKVKLIGKTKHTLLNKNGKIFFEFDLKPKETKVVEFGYEVEKPTKK